MLKKDRVRGAPIPMDLVRGVGLSCDGDRHCCALLKLKHPAAASYSPTKNGPSPMTEMNHLLFLPLFRGA